MAHKNNEQNLTPLNQKSKEEQWRIRSLGGQASQRKQRERRTFAEILQTIGDLDCVDVEIKEQFKEMGYDGEISNKVAWVLPFVANIKKGDSKSFQMAMEMLKEDRKRELEIQRLTEEVEKLKLEQEQLKTLNSAMQDNIQIIMNIPKEEINIPEEVEQDED